MLGNDQSKNMSVEAFGPKIIRAISSIEYCGCLFDESNIRKGLGSGSSQRAMIPSLC